MGSASSIDISCRHVKLKVARYTRDVPKGCAGRPWSRGWLGPGWGPLVFASYYPHISVSNQLSGLCKSLLAFDNYIAISSN